MTLTHLSEHESTVAHEEEGHDIIDLAALLREGDFVSSSSRSSSSRRSSSRSRSRTRRRSITTHQPHTAARGNVNNDATTARRTPSFKHPVRQPVAAWRSTNPNQCTDYLYNRTNDVGSFKRYLPRAPEKRASTNS